jgi:hypothetical protein
MCTVVVGLRAEGLIVPAVLNGPIDIESFHAYVIQVLVPNLRPGDCVVLDNLNVHKDPATMREIIAAGATVHFLPPLQSGPEPDRARVRKTQGVPSRHPSSILR